MNKDEAKELRNYVDKRFADVYVKISTLEYVMRISESSLTQSSAEKTYASEGWRERFENAIRWQQEESRGRIKSLEFQIDKLEKEVSRLTNQNRTSTKENGNNN